MNCKFSYITQIINQTEQNEGHMNIYFTTIDKAKQRPIER
uniref:RecQl3 n=1 Tax=Arundo donax TaxID=35708 RepID=A0A0A9HQJ3_ARUDO